MRSSSRIRLTPKSYIDLLAHQLNIFLGKHRPRVHKYQEPTRFAVVKFVKQVPVAPTPISPQTRVVNIPNPQA